jgi:hypothetical protein
VQTNTLSQQKKGAKANTPETDGFGDGIMDKGIIEAVCPAAGFPGSGLFTQDSADHIYPAGRSMLAA